MPTPKKLFRDAVEYLRKNYPLPEGVMVDVKYSFVHSLPQSAEDKAAWLARHGQFKKLSPRFGVIKLAVKQELVTFSEGETMLSKSDSQIIGTIAHEWQHARQAYCPQFGDIWTRDRHLEYRERPCEVDARAFGEAFVNHYLKGAEAPPV